MENRSRNESSKPASARKKNSVELHMVRRKALADKNNIPTIPALHNTAAVSGKENKDRQIAYQSNTTGVKERKKGNAERPKPTLLPSTLTGRKKLQNLNLPIISESEDTENVADVKANELSVYSKDSESVSFMRGKESKQNNTSLKKTQQDESVCDLSTKSDQLQKSRRHYSVWEHLESLLYVEDYRQDIVHHLQKREKELCLQEVPKCSQFAKLHAVIVNWLTKLLSDLDLQDELLFITITLLDRLFTKLHIPINKLQLAAMACLWIAIKQNMNANILASELISTCKVVASVKELIEMESKVLTKLNFNITVIEPLLFVNYYLHEMKVTERRIKQICKYLLDITLLNSEYCITYPSLIGSAAVYAALSICGKQTVWDVMQKRREFHKPYQFSHISDAMLNELKMICLNEAKFRAAYSKHRKVKNGKISKRLTVKQNELCLL